LSLLVTRKPPLTKAMYFDGVSNYVDVADMYDFTTNQIYAEALVWLQSIVWSVRNQILYNFPNILYLEHDGRFPGRLHAELTFSDYTNSYDVIDNFFSSDVWIHVGYGYDGQYTFAVKNGSVVQRWLYGKTLITGSPRATLISYNLGINTHWQGYIAYIRLYNRAPSQSEILHNYRNPNNPVRSGLVLWLDARNVIGNKWYDLSGYGNHGTIYGATLVTLPNPPSGW